MASTKVQRIMIQLIVCFLGSFLFHLFVSIAFSVFFDWICFVLRRLHNLNSWFLQSVSSKTMDLKMFELINAFSNSSGFSPFCICHIESSDPNLAIWTERSGHRRNMNVSHLFLHYASFSYQWVANEYKKHVLSFVGRASANTWTLWLFLYFSH